MDILFNPSVTETFGNVTLEAMACNLPVVAAKATGSESLVCEGVTGRLVRPGAITQFANALQHYCEDAERRRAAGGEGHRRACEHSWDQVKQSDRTIKRPTPVINANLVDPHRTSTQNTH